MCRRRVCANGTMTLSTCFARRSASVWLSEAADALASVFFPGPCNICEKLWLREEGL
jgi:hypothetical protein